jgi:pyridoxine/pyridoxamine 5'-phosphate oxidase
MAIEHKDIAAIREDYAMSSLSEEDVDRDPLLQFIDWFDQARDAHVTEPNAMVLSTINNHNFPSSRVVLLKDIKADGFSFFTNYNSQKAQDILSNNKASLLFFWPELQRILCVTSPWKPSWRMVISTKQYYQRSSSFGNRCLTNRTTFFIIKRHTSPRLLGRVPS